MYNIPLDYNDPKNRYPLGTRDYAYINKMEMINDYYWRETERWHYYNIDNQNYILPTIVSCFLLFFTAPPIVTIPVIILIVLFVLCVCHLNNKKLDNDPYAQMCRKQSRELRRNVYHMDV